MQRIYLPDTLFWEHLIIDEKQMHHQITRVMRARVWDTFVFFDGRTLRDFYYCISDINKREIYFYRSEIQEKQSEISPDLTLYQAIPNKLEKIEFIVQKCCEIWYKKIIFFPGEHSQKLVISENKKLRIQKIAIESIEQCGGNIIPEIEFWAKNIIQSDMSLLWAWLFLFCHTKNNSAITLQEISDIFMEHIHIFVGPEGGFSHEELEKFEQANFYRVHFGHRVLRCETAGIAAWFYLSQK